MADNLFHRLKYGKEIRQRIADIEAGKANIDWPRFRLFKSLELYLALMRNCNIHVAEAAAHEILTTQFSDDLEPRLIELLENDRSSCRLEAVRCLKRLGTSASLKPLFAVVSDEDATVRREAVTALERISKRSGKLQAADISRLLQKNRYPDIQKKLLTLLAETGDQGALMAVEAEFEKARAVPWTIPADLIRDYGRLAGGRALPALVEILEDPGYTRAMDACRKEEWNRRGSNLEVDIIRNRFHYNNWRSVRRACIDALVEICDQDAIPVLTVISTTDPASTLRDKAAAAVREILRYSKIR